MKTLNVQKVNRKTLLRIWKITGKFLPSGELFIRSDKEGNVNYNKAPVYSWPEIQQEQKRRPVHFTVPPHIFKV